MRGSTLTRLLRVAALLPLFLGAVSPATIRTLVCRYTGVIMPEETCCPEPTSREQETQSRLAEASCCVAKTIHLARVASDLRRESAGPQLGFACTDIDSPLPAAAYGRPAPVWRAGVPPPGPPIILVKHAFLI